MFLEEKKVCVSAMRSCMVRAQAECALSEQENEVLKRTNDDLIEHLACINIKSSRRKITALLSTVPKSLLGFELIFERYIEVGVTGFHLFESH